MPVSPSRLMGAIDWRIETGEKGFRHPFQTESPVVTLPDGPVKLVGTGEAMYHCLNAPYHHVGFLAANLRQT